MNISTFSLVARDPVSGQIAVAGGTNWFNYGRWVPHIEAGVGALATQAETNMWYAPNGLADLKKGLSAQETVNDLLREDPDKNGIHQLLVMDNSGATACHTGNACHLYAGQICQPNFAVAGNTLVDEKTLEAVVDYYHKSNEPFGLKLIKALQAGHMAGGDIRGMKSAALKIAKGASSGKYWNDILFDLRVDEHADPLKELERLYYVAEAYRFIDSADSATEPNEALEFYKKALALDPENAEIKFWMARNHHQLGDFGERDRLRDEIRKTNKNWDIYWDRLDRKAR